MWYKNPVNLVYIISFVDLFAVGLIFPIFGTRLRDLGASHTLVGAFSSVYAGIQVFSGPVVGGWSDVKDRKSVLKLILLFSGLGYGLLAFTESFTLIACLRIFIGCFKHIQSITKAVISDIVPPQKHIEAFGKSSAISSLGFILGPLIGGQISDGPNGYSYICCLTMILFWLNIIIFYSKKAIAPESNNIDPILKKYWVLGQYLNIVPLFIEYWTNIVCYLGGFNFQKKVTVTVSYLPEGTKKKNEDISPRSTANINNGIVKQVKIELKKTFLNFKSIDWPIYWEAFALRFLFGLVMSAYFSNQTILLKEKFNLSPKASGYVISYYSLVGACLAYFIDKINMFYHSNDCLTKLLHSFCVLAICVIVMFLSTNMYTFLFILIPFSICGTLFRIVSMELILEKTGGKHRGSMSGVSNSIMSISRFFTPVILGILGDKFGAEYMILVAVIPAVIGICLCVHLKIGQNIFNR